MPARRAEFGLAKLADDLLGVVSLPWHPDLLSNSPSLTFGLDQVSGVRSAGVFTQPGSSPEVRGYLENGPLCVSKRTSPAIAFTSDNSHKRTHATRQQRLRLGTWVIAFYYQRGTAEQHIKEGKNAINWTRLSRHSFRNNEVRLQLHALAYNLGNFLRTLALPEAVEHWSLTTLREKLIKIGTKVVRHGRYITFQFAEVAIPRSLFANILRLIGGLRPAPLPP